MGIDYSGGMLVGCHGSDLAIPEDYEGDVYDFCEEFDLIRYAEHYDADIESSYVGFSIDDVYIDTIDDWLVEVKTYAKEFEKLTGVKAQLIGCQDIY